MVTRLCNKQLLKTLIGFIRDVIDIFNLWDVYIISKFIIKLKILILYILFYILLLQVAQYNLFSTFLAFWFIFFNIIYTNYPQLLINILQLNVSYFLNRFFIVLFTWPYIFSEYINILLTTRLSLLNLIRYIEKEKIFNLFFNLDSIEYFNEEYKLKKYIINTVNLNYIIVILLIINISLALLKYITYIIYNTKNPYNKNYSNIIIKKCMFKQHRYKSPSNQVFKNPKIIPIYKSKVVKVREISPYRTKHGTVMHQFEACPTFNSWRTLFPKNTKFNATSTKHKDCISICKKLIYKRGKVEVREQYFRKSNIKEFLPNKDFKATSSAELYSLLTSGQILVLKDRRLIFEKYATLETGFILKN